MTARTGGIVALVGVLGWIGMIWLGVTLYAAHPPNAGFDLEVLLRAGRQVAAGGSPYDQAVLTGSAPVAERLFYSYPPPIAQALSLVAAVPSGVMLIVWDAAAVVALASAAGGLTRRLAPDLSSVAVVGIVVALVPLMFPLAIGLLFGNLDVFFPAAYGLMVVAALPAATRADRARGGIGLALASIAKVAPALLAGWFVVRAVRRPALWGSVAVAVIVGLSIVAISVAVGGFQPWLDYGHLLLVRAGSGADLIDPRNAAPATQLALVFRDPSNALALASTLQGPVTIAAVVAALGAAWRARDPLSGFAWAAAASLVLLPVTWYHYPSAMIPIAIAAVLRSRAQPVRARRVQGLIVAAAILAALAIAWLPLIWPAVALVLVATHASATNADAADANADNADAAAANADAAAPTADPGAATAETRARTAGAAAPTADHEST
jgi:hypothetical protein